MTILFCDGFDHYDQILEKWDMLYTTGYPGNTISTTAGRFGGGAFQITNGTGYAQKNISSTTFCYLGFALNPAAKAQTGNTYRDVIALYDGVSGKLPFLLRLYHSGCLELRNSDNTVFAASTLSVTGAAWQYVECKFTLLDAGGEITCKVGGTTFCTSTGDTKPASVTSFDAIRFGGYCGYSADVTYVDDFYYEDSQYLGDVEVQAIYPVDAGSETDWSPSAIPNWAQVDDSTPDDDGSFVYSTTLNSTDTYEYSKIDAGAGTIYAVVANIDTMKTDPGSRTLCPVVVTGTYSGTGPSIQPLSSYKIMQSIMMNDPITAVTWSVTDVNTYEFGHAIES